MIREIKLRVKETDYQGKLSHAIRFLESKDQLKLTVMLRGREVTHPESGEYLLFEFVKDLEGYGKAELPPIREPKQVFLVFTPNAAGSLIL